MKAKHALGLAALALLASCQQPYRDKIAGDPVVSSSYKAPDMGTPAQLAAPDADAYISKADPTTAAQLWIDGLNAVDSLSSVPNASIQTSGPRVIFRSTAGSTFTLPRGALKLIASAAKAPTPRAQQLPATTTANSPNGDYILQTGSYTPVTSSETLLASDSSPIGDHSTTSLYYIEDSVDFVENGASTAKLFKNYVHYVNQTDETKNINGTSSLVTNGISSLVTVSENLSPNRDRRSTTTFRRAAAPHMRSPVASKRRRSGTPLPFSSP